MARTTRFKIVVDTNVLVRGLADPDSPSGHLLHKCETRAVLMLLSRSVIQEYRDVLLRDEMTLHHPAINEDAVNLVIERLRYYADVVNPVTARFRFDRDPEDERFIALAIDGSATHIVTHDNDLLSLPTAHSDAAKRFRQRLPNVRVMRPAEFLDTL